MTIASSVAILNAAIASRHDSRKWSRPLIVAEEEPEEQPEPATELQAPSKDSIDYYLRQPVQEPYIITIPEAPEIHKKQPKGQDSYLPSQNSASSREQPVQFSLSTRMNFTNTDEVRKPQVFPQSRYGSLPKKFLGFKNKPHYLKFYADDALPKVAPKGAQQKFFESSSPQSEYIQHSQPKEITQRLSKHIIESKTEKKILPRQPLPPIFDSESEAVVPRLSYIKPIAEANSSEEDDEEESEKIVEVVKPTKTKKAKSVKPKLGALTDGKQRVEFQMHGHDGPQSYKFGYDTGKGYVEKKSYNS